MEINESILVKVAQEGSEQVSQALSRLANTIVNVEVSKSEVLSGSKVLGRIKPAEEHSIVVYAQVTTGVPGVSILTIGRDKALDLVDILAQQPIGTTGILKDLDRSAIKEMLNILSNAYMTALAKSVKVELEMGVPTMITTDRLGEILNVVEKDSQETDKNAVIFETVLKVASHEIKISLYLIFDEKFAAAVNGEGVEKQ